MLDMQAVRFFVSSTGINRPDLYVGAKGDWDFWISDLIKNPDGTDI